MPRKKRVITETIDDTPNEDVSPASPDLEVIDEDEQTLSSILSEYGSVGVRIKVYRQGQRGPEYCFSSDEPIEEDHIQSQYGGGEYTLRVFINNVYRKSIKIRIADIQPNGHRVAATSAPTMDFQTAMLQQQNAFLQNMIQAVLKTGPIQTTPVNELAQALEAVEKIKGSRSSETSFIDAFFKGIELAKDLNGTSDWKSDLIRTAREAIPHVTKALENHRPAGVSMQQPNSTESMIRAGITELKKKCLANVPPDLIVDWVAHHANDEQYQRFLQLVFTQDFAAFAAIDSEIATEPYVGWFKRLYDGLRSAFSEQDQMDGNTTGTDGNETNVIDHGEVSEGRGKE